MTILPTSGGFSSWESNFLFLDLTADWCLCPPICFQLPRPLFFKKKIFFSSSSISASYVAMSLFSSGRHLSVMSGLLEDDWRVSVSEETARPLRCSPTIVPTPLPPALVDSGVSPCPPPPPTHPGAALTPFDFSQNGALSDFYEAQSGTVLGS